ncbi:hypothetical protein IW261DRAFT_1643641 [Armillaria novae-zelandiae]|uniref:DUF6535 domain-containing protein n=1 Tax=Armillaria novae-zelandiae TaxID=153914 RepID=A0AA39UBF1_9AGAR|nr:hypothetical protein IW261DRAFT_1643641 [Armillaria novae-zelandiae]
MATNFVRIAFQDDAWASQYDEPGQEYITHRMTAADLVFSGGTMLIRLFVTFALLRPDDPESKVSRQTVSLPFQILEHFWREDDHSGSSRPGHSPARIKSWLNHQLRPYSGTNEGVARLCGDGQFEIELWLTAVVHYDHVDGSNFDVVSKCQSSYSGASSRKSNPLFPKSWAVKAWTRFYCESKGNDPFDYEQKLPEDKQYEELGPAARVWRTYLEECGLFDHEMVEGWKDGLDVLLVFTSQSLQLDYTQVTASLPYELTNVQRAAASGALVDSIPRSALTPFSDFQPATSDLWVNGLWFTSLSLSLATALVAVLMKQWIHLYMAVPSGTPRDRCHVRQFRYMGLQEWRVPFIIGLLPVLMSVSLGVFLAGLVIFLVPLRLAIASVVGAITFTVFAGYIITNFLPILYPSCPYKTPLSQYVFSLYTHIIHNGLLNWCISSIFKSQISEKPPVRTLKDAEREAVRRSAENTDVYALSWLFSMSSNPSVQSIVAQSISALPLKSVDLLNQHMRGVSLTCAEVINNCVGTQPVLEQAQQAKVERLVRAHLRVRRRDDKTWFYISTTLDMEHVQPDLLAGIAASTPFWKQGHEAQEVVRRSLLGSPTERQLRLQPIVWINLLGNAFATGGLGLSRSLLDAIPDHYWRQDWVCPGPVFTVDRSESTPFICDSVNYNDALTFQEAVRSSIYPYIANYIITYHSPKDVPNNSHHILPVAEDPRLRFLLAMSTPSFSLQANIQFSLMDKMTEYIEINLNVDMLPLGFLSCSSLDSNRLAALETLYSLILSDMFGNASVLGWHGQRSALRVFLRLITTTSPLPGHLSDPSEWCTPAVATKFINVVFDISSINGWTSNYHYRDLRTVSEIMAYLFEFSPIANQAYSTFVKMRYFDVIERLLRPSLPSEILRCFIVGLNSSFLDPHVRQETLDYLHEPHSRIVACTALFPGSDESTLRQLAMIQPDDSAWPTCLQHFDSDGASPRPCCPSAVSKIVSSAFIITEPTPAQGASSETRVPHRDSSLLHDDTSGNILNRIIVSVGQWRRKSRLLEDTVPSSLNGNV